jgi:hypothetical protein
MVFLDSVSVNSSSVESFKYIGFSGPTFLEDSPPNWLIDSKKKRLVGLLLSLKELSSFYFSKGKKENYNCFVLQLSPFSGA